MRTWLRWVLLGWAIGVAGCTRDWSRVPTGLDAADDVARDAAVTADADDVARVDTSAADASDARIHDALDAGADSPGDTGSDVAMDVAIDATTLDGPVDAPGTDACVSPRVVCGGACVEPRSVSACGASCAVCVAPMNATATCDGTSCDFTCDEGFVRSGAQCAIAPPRPIAPLSLWQVRSRRPTLRWQPPAGGAATARVQVCREPRCASGSVVLDEPMATSPYVLPMDLARGAYFWRLYGRRADGAPGTAPSATWQFVVPARASTVTTGAPSRPVADFSHDGVASVLVSATESGRVYIHRGNATGVPASPTSSLARSRLFGRTTAVSDFDGDGVGDLLVGGTRAWIYWGDVGGLSSTRFTAPPIPSSAAHDEAYAFNVGAVGDLNGDGYGDLLVTSPVYDPTDTTTNPGRAYVYYGRADRTFDAPDVVLTGPGREARFGWNSLAGMDLDADGVNDLILGDESSPNLFVYSGRTLASGAMPTARWNVDDQPYVSSEMGYGDFDGDGYDEVFTGIGEPRVIFGSSAIPAAVAPIALPNVLALAEGRYLAGVGDTNADGFDDVVYSAETARQVRLVLGAATQAGPWTSRVVVPPAEAAGMDGQFGAAVGSPGDANADGLADFVVGAPSAVGPGFAVVVYGNDARAPTVLPGIAGAMGEYDYGTAVALRRLRATGGVL